MTTIRRAATPDAPTLARLVQTVQQQHIDAHPEIYKPIDPNDPALIAFYAQHLADSETYIFIAERDEQPVGFVLCKLRRISGNPFLHPALDFHIDQMSVQAEHQSQGIGGQLMETVLDIAKQVDADTISLGVSAFNRRAARFYERYGFRARSQSMYQRL